MYQKAHRLALAEACIHLHVVVLGWKCVKKRAIGLYSGVDRIKVTYQN